eukprot:Em0076g5a
MEAVQFLTSISEPAYLRHTSLSSSSSLVSLSSPASPCVCGCCCICVACHRRRKRIKLRAEMKYQDEKEQIRMTSAARKADRREKNDEIRKKYGLSGDPK